MIRLLVRQLLLTFVLALLLLAVLERFNPTPPPLAVQLHLAAAPAAMPPMRLYETCPLERRQVPIIPEREA
jgi:hypothetical protein